MKLWEEQKIKDALSKVPGVTLTGTSPGEDRTTTQLTYEVAGASDLLYVRGFRTDETNVDQSNPEIEMIEVTSGYSDGGDSREGANVIARARIHVALLDLNYEVVRSMDPYF